MTHPLVGSNDLIRHLTERPGRFVLKTITRRGAIYTYSDALKPLRNEMIERLIAKGRLVPREASGQGWELSEDVR